MVIKLKRFNISIFIYSLLLAFCITSVFIILSYFYIQELRLSYETQEKYQMLSYMDKISKQEKTIDEFKEYLFGTLESFVYKMALINKNGEIIYNTFESIPKVEPLNTLVIIDKKIIYHDSIKFSETRTHKIILEKELDYIDVNKKLMIISILIVCFFLMCSLLIYLHTAKIHNLINRNFELFLKDAIHEIRTPLGVIQINLEFLESNLDGSMPLLRAQGALQNLISIYEGIEYFIKDTKVTYTRNRIDISSVLEKRLEFFKILADIKKLTIISKIDKDIFMETNIIEIQRLIDNNLSNAIKYAYVGTTINIILENHHNVVKLLFSNYGEQIKDINKIFQRYVRGDNIRGGFGLGLNIVKNICDKYKIVINVSSKEDGYTTFIYNIPIKHIDRKL